MEQVFYWGANTSAYSTRCTVCPVTAELRLLPSRMEVITMRRQVWDCGVNALLLVEIQVKEGSSHFLWWHQYWFYGALHWCKICLVWLFWRAQHGINVVKGQPTGQVFLRVDCCGNLVLGIILRQGQGPPDRSHHGAIRIFHSGLFESSFCVRAREHLYTNTGRLR